MTEEALGVDQILAPQPLTPTEVRATKTSGALVGAAVADAMGWITEFLRSDNQLFKVHSVAIIEDFIPWKKRSGGRFNTYIDYINPGEYSDDTQLSLCSARAVVSRTEFDVAYFAKTELPLWLEYARGAGATITAAARALAKKTGAWNRNFFQFKRGRQMFDYRDAGANGAAMRIGPIALAMAENPQALWVAVFKNAITTHGHPRAILGAHIYACALAYLIRTENLDFGGFIRNLEEAVAGAQIPREIPEIAEWIHAWNAGGERNFDPEFQRTKDESLSGLRMLRSVRDGEVDFRHFLSKLGCFDPKTRGSGSSTAIAAIAYFVVYGGNFRKMVIQAVNQLGTDTDTIASMAAALGGAFRGIGVVPEPWANKMQDFPYLMRVADALAEISVGSPHWPSIAYRGDPVEKFPDIREIIAIHRVAKGQRVGHPIFGPGWVRNVDVQHIKGTRKGEMMLATVGFDMGQSCKFKKYLPAQSSRPVDHSGPTRLA